MIALPATLLLALVPLVPQAEDVSESLQAVRDDMAVPGLVALAFQEGEVLAWGAAGVRAAGGKDPIRLDDPIHLGSCSKAMTATVAARLVEEGLLKWNSTLAEVVPEFAAKVDEGFHDVTLIELLRHRGGIAERRRPELGPAFLRMQGMEGDAAEVRREILALVLSNPPLAPPESGYDYSNYGYMTAGMMMEHVTGKSWGTLLETRLFEPLGLDSAGLGSPAGDGVPVGHVREDSAWSPLPPGPSGFLPDAMAPAGLVHCNLRDWARFVAEHLKGNRAESEFLETSNFKVLHQDPGGGYAAGWGLAHHRWSWGEGAVLTHNGSDNTWFSLVFAMPEWDLVVVTATNAAGTAGQRACDRARDLLLETTGYRD